MLLPLKILIVALASTVPPGSHHAHHGRHEPPAHTKRRAELNVLAVAVHSWHKQAEAARLVDPGSDQLRNNVQAICHGRGVKIGTRYRRFVCVLRAWPPSDVSRLVVSYRARSADRFRVRLLTRTRRG